MPHSWRTPTVILICATTIMLLSFGIRQTYGLFLAPMSSEFGWSRGIFSLAVALQSLIWGGAQPFLGALADRFGSAKVIAFSALIYVAGLYLMSVSSTPAAMIWSTAFLTGIAMSGTSFTLLLAVIGTSGIVAQIFGVKYMAMLYGIVFLSHQIGSFLGIWLGGVLFDYTGSYDIVWWAAVCLGVAAALIHWPIDERALSREQTGTVADPAAG